MSELSFADQAKLMLPPGGRWWTGKESQAPMLEVFRANGGLPMSWDNGHGGKMFGVYPPNQSKQDLMLLLLDIPWAHRHAYEMLVENIPCKGYADIDWVGQSDPDHNTLKRLVAAIRSKSNEVHRHNPKIYVCCGTRPTKSDPSIYKHSYHIVLEDIIYERNNDGQMKSFFTTIPGFTWMDECEEKPMVDPRVYTKNRHFRLPLCTKIGSSPLVRISGAPLDDDFTIEQNERDALAVLPFFISNPDRNAPCVFIQTPPALQQLVSNKGTNAKRARTNTDMQLVQSTSKFLPVPIHWIQSLLVKAGDNTTTLGTPEYLPGEDQWKIQGNHQGHGRKCLVKPGTTHESNNCLLFVERFENGFKVNYFCTASECSKYLKPVLGYISFNVQQCDWQIALSPIPQQEEAMHEDDDESNEMQEDEPDSGPEAPDQEMSETDATPELKSIDPPHDPDNPAFNTYEKVKERFELVCFKVKAPFYYARIEKNHDPLLHSHVDLQHYYCDWTYWGPNKDGDTVQLSFISKWLRDPNKRVVERIVVDPTNTMQGVYNMWRGFDAEKLPPVDDALVPELVRDITKHLSDVITNGVDDHTKFLEHYLANMVQRPERKAQVALYLYGAQGCGKGIIFEFLRLKILGTHCSYQTSKPEHDLFSRFANGGVNRVFIQVDETRNLHDHSDQIKDFITNPTLNYEKKGKDTIVLANIANLVLTSNNANSLTVSPDDRRFALFHCSSVHKGDTDYFDRLGDHLERPEVARAYYQYLMSMDLSAYPTSFQHARPITEYYRESQHNSIPIISRFFSAMVNTEYPEQRVPARDLYRKYVQFHTDGNYKILMTETAFGRETKRINGVEKKRAPSGFNYLLDHASIKKHLADANEYDPDAEF